MDDRFFVTGGTLRGDAPSYVVRAADAELFEHLARAELCYVLTARQMGKSSLMVRTAAKLRAEGVAVLTLDLTAVGQNVSPEQWYQGLLLELAQAADVEDEIDDHWATTAGLGAFQRWRRGLRDVILPGLERNKRLDPASFRAVLFIDEIDAVRSLPFSTDELFAGIREITNNRASDDRLGRLTFCLLGVAVPTDLIRDPRTTPFNIGRRVDLDDFARSEAVVLSDGLDARLERAPALLDRVLHWTGGHPYLTQRLCLGVSNAAGDEAPPKLVDRVCEELFLSPKAREQDANLLFVRERLLRADVDLASWLDLYRRVRRRQVVVDDDVDPLVDLLKLSGIARPRDGRLEVRNRIYARVFDDQWIRATMPGAELRRQRAAYRRGVLRTAGIALLALVVVGGLAATAWSERNRAEEMAEQSQRALIRLYVTDGSRQLLGNDLIGSLPWFAQALRSGQGSPEAARVHRARLASVLAQCPRPVHFFAHRDGVIHLETSADGARLASASRDGTARVWDLGTGRPVTPPLRHDGWVVRASFDGDGSRLVTASWDGSARVWSVASGAPATEPLRHRDAVVDASFSPDGRAVVTASEDGTARLWNAETGAAIGVPLAHEAGVTVARFSPDGRTVLTASRDGTARLWNAETGEPVLRAPLRHRRTVVDARFSEDGTRVVTASMDGTVQLWDTATGRAAGSSIEHPDWAMSATFSPDRKRVVTTCRDGGVRLFDATTGAPLLRDAIVPGGTIGGVSFSADGTRLATAGSDGAVRTWRTSDGRMAAPPLWHIGAVADVAFIDHATAAAGSVVSASHDGVARLWHLAEEPRPVSPIPMAPEVIATELSSDGARIATANQGRTASVWSVADQQRVTLQHEDTVWHVSLSRDGRYAVTASADGTARIWDAVSGAPLGDPLTHASEVTIARFSPDSRLVATAAADGTVHLWARGSGREALPPLRLGGEALALQLSPDGGLLVAGGADHKAYVWRTSDGAAAYPALGHDAAVTQVRIDPSGRRLATASADGSVKLWELSTGAPAGEPLRHAEAVGVLAFSADGSLLATAAERSARVWNTGTGTPRTGPLDHPEPVRGLELSRDGARLLVWADSARVWEVDGSAPLTPLRRASGALWTARFEGDGWRVLLASRDGLAIPWDLSPGTESEAQLVALSEIVAGRRVDATGSLVPLEAQIFRLGLRTLGTSEDVSGKGR